MWLRGCVERCRGGYCFRACVARDPETPLTKLHVMQPVLGAAAAPLTLCCVALLLLTVPVAVLTLLEGAELHTLELLCADLALTFMPSLPAGAPRTYHVRWPDCARSAHARATHEQLNINLTRRIDCLEGNASHATARRTTRRTPTGRAVRRYDARP